MPKARLTDTRIAGFRPAKDEFLRDTESHLAVRARVTGANVSRTFVFESTLEYKNVRITLGEVESFPLTEARRWAQELQALVDNGIDPRQALKDRAASAKAQRAEELVRREAEMAEAKRRFEAERLKQLTVGEAWREYLEARRSKWGERHFLNHLNMAKEGGEPRTRGRRPGEPSETLPGPLHPLLNMRVCELDGEVVRRWLEPLAERTPTQATQTFRALRAFIAWCGDRPEYREIVIPDACNRRIARDTLPRARAKDDCLQREQLKAWFEHVRRIRNPVIAAYLQTLLLTGARRKELAALRSR